jgi:hypothetical protein
MATAIRKLHEDRKRQERRHDRRFAQARRAYIRNTPLRERVTREAFRSGGCKTTEDAEGRRTVQYFGRDLRTLVANTDWTAYPPDTHERVVILDWLHEERT